MWINDCQIADIFTFMQIRTSKKIRGTCKEDARNKSLFELFPLIVRKNWIENQESIHDYTYYALLQSCVGKFITNVDIFIMSVAIANKTYVSWVSLKKEKKKKTDKEYRTNIIIKIPPNPKSSRRRDHGWRVEQKSIETFYEKGCLFANGSPFSLIRSPIGIIPGIVTCGLLSVHGFAVGLCPLYFHADDSCLPAFVMHDAMHFYFHFATRRKTWLRFRSTSLESDSIFAKRRRSDPLHHSWPSSKNIPSFFLQRTREGIASADLLHFSLLFVGSISLEQQSSLREDLLLRRILPLCSSTQRYESVYVRERKREIAITA